MRWNENVWVNKYPFNIGWCYVMKAITVHEIHSIHIGIVNVFLQNHSARRYCVVSIVVGGIELFSEDVAIRYINRKMFMYIEYPGKTERTYTHTHKQQLYLCE